MNPRSAFHKPPSPNLCQNGQFALSELLHDILLQCRLSLRFTRTFAVRLLNLCCPQWTVSQSHLLRWTACLSLTVYMASNSASGLAQLFQDEGSRTFSREYSTTYLVYSVDGELVEHSTSIIRIPDLSPIQQIILYDPPFLKDINVPGNVIAEAKQTINDFFTDVRADNPNPANYQNRRDDLDDKLLAMFESPQRDYLVSAACRRAFFQSGVKGIAPLLRLSDEQIEEVSAAFEEEWPKLREHLQELGKNTLMEIVSELDMEKQDLIDFLNTDDFGYPGASFASLNLALIEFESKPFESIDKVDRKTPLWRLSVSGVLRQTDEVPADPLHETVFLLELLRKHSSDPESVNALIELGLEKALELQEAYAEETKLAGADDARRRIAIDELANNRKKSAQRLIDRLKRDEQLAMQRIQFAMRASQWGLRTSLLDYSASRDLHLTINSGEYRRIQKKAPEIRAAMRGRLGDLESQLFDKLFKKYAKNMYSVPWKLPDASECIPPFDLLYTLPKAAER